MTKEQIEVEFKRFGPLEDFKLLRERSCAFVDYVRMEDAVAAVEALNRKRIGEDTLRVDFGKSSTQKRVCSLKISDIFLLNIIYISTCISFGLCIVIEFYSAMLSS